MKLPAFLNSRTGLGIALMFGLTAGGLAAVLGSSLAPEKPKLTVENAPAVTTFNTPGFPQIKRGDFELVDHRGNLRTSKSKDGNYQLLFFGYAKCKAICAVALPNIAEATDLLEGMGATVTPLLITVDPKRDTIAALKREVVKIHPRMVGLTGDEKSLAASYKVFGLTKKFLFTHVDEGDVFSHGSFIYLLGPDGEFKTLFPPVTSPVRIAEVSAGYITKQQIN